MTSIATIRRGQPHDLANVQRLNRTLFQYEHDQGFYAGDIFNLNWPYEEEGTKYFTDCLSDSPSSAIFIAEANDVVVGYLAATFMPKAYYSKNPVGELENMFVDAAYRQQGIGTRLIDAFKTWARENRVARIRVAASAANHRSIALYHRCGFSDQVLILDQPLT